MAVPAHNVESMSKLVQPATKQDLRSFLGALSYYESSFLPLASTRTNSPLPLPRPLQTLSVGRRKCWSLSII